MHKKTKKDCNIYVLIYKMSTEKQAAMKKLRMHQKPTSHQESTEIRIKPMD